MHLIISDDSRSDHYHTFSFTFSTFMRCVIHAGINQFSFFFFFLNPTLLVYSDCLKMRPMFVKLPLIGYCWTAIVYPLSTVSLYALKFSPGGGGEVAAGPLFTLILSSQRSEGPDK